MRYIPENKDYADFYKAILNLGEYSAEITFAFYLSRKKAYYGIDNLTQTHIKTFFYEAIIDAIKETYPFSLRYIVFTDKECIFASLEGVSEGSHRKELKGIRDLVELNQDHHYDVLLRDNVLEVFSDKFKDIGIDQDTWLFCLNEYTHKNNLLKYPEGVEFFRYDLFLKYCMDHKLADTLELFKAYCDLYPQKAEDYLAQMSFGLNSEDVKNRIDDFRNSLESSKISRKSVNF